MNILDNQAMRAHYLRALLSRYSTLPLLFHSSSHQLPLQAVFQPLKLCKHPSPLKKTSKEPSGRLLSEDENYQVTRPHHVKKIALHGADALKQSSQRRIVVLGDPGMGKTTLLKDLLRRAAQQALTDPAAPLPLFLSLPDLARSGATIQAYLPRILAAFQVDPRYISALLDATATGQSFFCQDSLDEVQPALRPGLIALINHNALSMGGTWVIGSRFSAYQGGQFAPGRFDEWELQPLDEASQACDTIQRTIPDAAIQLLFKIRHDPQSRAVREAADRALARLLSQENTLEDG